MNKNIKNIIKEKVVRIKLSKKSIYNKILRSISQNNNIKNKIKIYTNFIFDKNLKKIQCKQKNIRYVFTPVKEVVLLMVLAFLDTRLKVLYLKIS
jgi:hypothetical protein